MTPTVSLAAVTAADFRPLLRESFQITLPGGEKVTATLAELTEQKPPRPDLRAPFSLIFHLPRDPRAPRPTQGILTVEHPAIGLLEVFAVPLQTVGDVAPWQIIFG
jgi:hypothetical protein